MKKASIAKQQIFDGAKHNRILGDRHKEKTYDPVRMGAMALEAEVGATAFPNRGAMVVNAEALAVRRAAAR